MLYLKDCGKNNLNPKNHRSRKNHRENYRNTQNSRSGKDCRENSGSRKNRLESSGSIKNSWKDSRSWKACSFGSNLGTSLDGTTNYWSPHWMHCWRYSRSANRMHYWKNYREDCRISNPNLKIHWNS